MMSSELTPGKKLSELRVIDLKQELDKRGLEKTGVKASLLDRLKKALENEGQDPEQYVFELISSKRSKGDDSLLEEQEEHADDKKSDGVLEDLDLDGVDCELEDDGIDIEDFVDTDVDNSKQELEPAKNETKSESSREEQKPEIAAMETDAVKKEAKSETPVITVDGVDSNDVMEKGPTKTESAEKTKQETNKENLLNYMDLAPPTPTSMPVIAPFTSEDTINMDTSGDRKEDDISLIVHVDESQNEFDMPETPSKASDNDSIQGSVSVDLDRGKIEEKAAADAEKAFTNGETTGDDSTKSTSKPATECSPPSGVDKINGGEKMDTETTLDKPQNETTVAGNDGKETSATGSDPKAATKKPDAKSKSSVNSRNLWISGLSTSTRATDLKALFSKYGKVAGAKVVTNARSPGSRCYGFVSMNTAEEASKCIQYLHRTELHGRMISVERAKTDPSQAKAITVPKKSPGKPTESKEEAPKKDSEKKEPEKEGEKKEGEKDKKVVEKKEGDKKDEKKTPEARRHSGGDHRHGNSRSYRRRSQGHSRHHSSKDKSKERDAKKEEPKKKEDGPEKAKVGGAEKKEVEVCAKGKPEEKKTEEKSVEKKVEEKKEEKKKSKEKEMLSLEKIKEERERERLRQRERRLREEERRRRELAERERIRERNRQREVMARQREESVRLQREREWIKVERERLEREKLEAEREKLRLERERRERERQELAEQRRVEALRYEERQRAMKRPYDNRGNDDYWGEPKRATYEQRDRGGYTDYDARPANSGEQRDRGYQQDRPADRYDRNAARPAERDQRTYDRRDDPAQRSGNARGGADKREVGRRDQPQSRDRDDRNRQPEDRYNKYESERDTRRDVPVRDHDRREQRRGASPHRPAPRDSPSNRRNDAGSSGYRGAADDRQSRDRGHENRAASDRSYSGHTATQRGSEPNAWTTAPVVGTRDAKDTRSYPRGAVSVASNGPGTSGIIGTGAGTWAAPDRRPAGHVVVPQAADPRAWQAVTSMPQRTVVNAPMLQVQPAPTTNAFLASAANIMMGVGLARGGDNRYDAYKTLPTTIRRY